MLSELRLVKEAGEIERLCEAALVAEAGMNAALDKGNQRGRYKMRIGLVKVFALLHRLAPSVVEGLVRSGH